MSTAPNGKIAHAHPAGVGHRTTTSAPHAPGPAPKVLDLPTGAGKSVTGDKGGKAPKAPKGKITSPARRKELMIAVLAVVVVVGAGVAVYSYFRTSDEPSKKNWDRAGGSQYDKAVGAEFDQLPFRRKRFVIEDLYERKSEIEKAFLAGQVKQSTYKTLLSYFWIAKKWKEIDKYASKSPQEKREYMAHLVDDELTPGLTRKAAQIENVKRDKPETKAIMDRFPAEEKQKINEFKEQLDEAVKWQERENKKIAAAAKAAGTRPTSRPTDNKQPAVKPTEPKPAGGAGAAVTAPKVK